MPRKPTSAGRKRHASRLAPGGKPLPPVKRHEAAWHRAFRRLETSACTGEAVESLVPPAMFSFSSANPAPPRSFSVSSPVKTKEEYAANHQEGLNLQGLKASGEAIFKLSTGELATGSREK
ncbi:hypothetical protein Bca52824_026577 [Brassica carinata]|uniref:Uncharacterized protein n=1 Tax=Brassica carinata TaxID=52824 RepID=A0A8X7SGX8_BRACI|nr:hypothetical protein Bca52824_026577 [Brassica carinata]